MLQVFDLHQQAETRLQGVSGNPKKIALFHTAIALGISFLLTVIICLFELLAAQASGLKGIRTHAMLTMVYYVLAPVVQIALPFWQMGIFYAALRWTKGEDATFGSLLQGFRRFGAVLRMLFLQVGLFLLLGIAVFNISNIIFMLTPFSDSYLELFKPFMEQGVTQEQLQALLTPEFTEATVQAAIPLLIIFAILYAVAYIPLFYRIRFAEFAVMDELSASRAILKSFAITKRKFWQLLRLDLSFWWFYLLQMLSVTICYADSILPAFGISLPVSDTVVTVALSLLGSVCQCFLLWQYEAKRLTVYGLAYRTLDGTIDSEDAPPLS